jgi:2-polyprenyl-6-methoxyphenol hydroxylase-like FAD-dependent oxidoreductase
VGDAAHLTSPMRGFGMLSGLFDSISLVEGLSAVALLGARDKVLERYSTMRNRNFWDFTSPRAAEMMYFMQYSDCQSPSLLDPAPSAGRIP